jgi:peptide methionine sulfoxide reductase msrA/msrB
VVLNISRLESSLSIKDLSLPENVLNVIRHKSTEMPYTGEYNDCYQLGTYLCRACGAALFRADSKFTSGCGWPSFDVAIAHAVLETPDADQTRVEIVCADCNAHLGHIFRGEGFTSRNTRYCVNSLSLDFVTDTQVLTTEEAIVAGGCFWGVQHLLAQYPGVLKTEVGYIGGNLSSPSYNQICTGQTGHFEAVRVLYTPTKINYEMLLRYFFEIHDPTQSAGQGPDHGSQYQSAVFYHTDEQRQIAEQLVDILKKKGFRVVTQILPMRIFWRAESYHQDYYLKNNQAPYCHRHESRF